MGKLEANLNKNIILYHGSKGGLRGDITDTVLLKALSALKLGRQYVAKTDRACSQIKIIKKEDLSTNQVKHYKQIGEKNRIEGARLAKSMMQKYRRDGKYIDELLGGEF